MRKWCMRACTALIAIALCMGAARADAKNPPPEDAYKCAKEAVSLISYGEYDMALSKLALSETYTAKELKKYVDANCKEIYKGSVQTEVSVAWYDGAAWQLAVPFEAPDDDAVGALVFTLTDGETFSAIAFSRWSDVSEGYGAASDAYWNVPYSPDYVIVGDW